MPELDARIRELIDTSAAPITLVELPDDTNLAIPAPVVAGPAHRVSRRGVALLAAAVLVAVAATVSAVVFSGNPHRRPAVPATEPPVLTTPTTTPAATIPRAQLDPSIVRAVKLAEQVRHAGPIAITGVQTGANGMGIDHIAFGRDRAGTVGLIVDRFMIEVQSLAVFDNPPLHPTTVAGDVFTLDGNGNVVAHQTVSGRASGVGQQNPPPARR
jgi:hypothetical protein